MTALLEYLNLLLNFSCKKFFIVFALFYKIFTWYLDIPRLRYRLGSNSVVYCFVDSLVYF